MILHRLELRRFLGLSEAAFDFAPGLNVIVGPNEAGKSTLRMAIRTVLYENPATTSPRFRDQFRSWGTDDPPELSLLFELNGRRFTLTKNYAARRVVLTDSLGQKWEAHKPVQERIVAALGLVTDDLFDATAHIAQAHLERIHVTSIGKELGRVVGGGGEDVTTAVRRLEAYVKGLERGSRSIAKEPGQLVALERRVTALREEVELHRRHAGEAERVRNDLTAVAADRARLEETSVAKRALLETNREILQLLDRLLARKREEQMWAQKVRQIEDYTAKLAALDLDLEAATAAGVVDEEPVVRVRRLHEQAQARERDLAAVRRDLEQPVPDVISPRKAWSVGGVGLLLLLGGMIASAGSAWGYFVAAIGLAAVGSAVVLGVRASQGQVAAVRREDRERRRAELERELNDLTAQLRADLDGMGCASVQEAETRLQRYRRLAEQRQQTADFLSSLREGRDDEAIFEAWNIVRRDIFGLEERLRTPEIAAKRLTPLQVQTLEGEVPALSDQLEQARRREIELTVTLERLVTDAEQLAVREEQLQEAVETQARVRRRHEVCKAALDGLLEARQAAEIPLREVVEKQVGDYLRTATDGRYTRVRVEGEDLELSAWSLDAGGWVPAQEPQLSRGTVDLLYLATRLALVTVLAGGKRPPLLFDDPFITFDEDRRKAAMEIVRAFSRDHQVLLFTCTRYYDAYAERLIELPARTDIAVSAPPRAPAAPPRQPSPPAAPAAPAPTKAPAVGPLWDQTSN